MAKKQGEDYLPIEFILNRKRKIVGISPAVDMIMGGVSEGTLNIVAGPEKSGKTTMLLHHAAKAQEQGFDVYYANVENRLKPRDLESIKGLQHDKFKLITSTPAVKDPKTGEVTTPAKIMTAEDYLTLIEKLLRDKERCLIIIDSESLLVSNNELTSEITDMQRCEGSRLLAKFMRRNSGVLSLNSHILWVVRHMMASPNGMTGQQEKGARAIAYSADNKLRFQYTERWKVKEKQIGQLINIRLEHGFEPNAFVGSTCTSYLRYGEGLDEVVETIMLAKDFGIIKDGTWVEYDDKKHNGLENLAIYLKENPKSFEKLLRQVKDLCS